MAVGDLDFYYTLYLWLHIEATDLMYKNTKFIKFFSKYKLLSYAAVNG